MALLLLIGDRANTPWEKALRVHAADVDLRIWPETGAPEDIRMAIAWKYPAEELTKYPNLECVASLGAGVDHLFRDESLPRGVRITRLVDPELTLSMQQYVVHAVLDAFREFDRYRLDETEYQWRQRAPKWACECSVGIMGLGRIGYPVAKSLSDLGFSVRGWTRTLKEYAGVDVYAGREQLREFLSGTQILVCLLPLTPETEGILNEDTLSQLPEGASVINVARGEHVVDQDLLKLLDDGYLSGACLDVFREEPLSKVHRFWTHPKVRVTPHIAAMTNAYSAAKQFLDNYHRLLHGQALLNEVSRTQGY